MTIIKYDLTGFANFRDGGALPAGQGRVRSLKLLRSDQPSGLDQQDIDYLQDLPLAAVIDLRTEMEDHAEPSPFAKAGFNVERHGIDAGSIVSMMKGDMTVETMYAEMIKHGGHAFAKAVTAVADGLKDGSVIVHCTAGKDRTGITIAMVQELVGVSRDDIAASYAITSQNLDGAWKNTKLEQITKFAGKEMAEKIEPLMVDSPPAAINGVLDHLDSEYGGVESYLVKHGMDSATVQKLREELVAG